jgi:hypothetical protein
MAVDEKVVQRLIDDYQGRFLGVDQLERDRLAFRAIKDFRNGLGDSTDESLAAAEHYLFSRYLVSNAIVSTRQATLMVLGYDGIKAIAQTSDRTEKAMRHNPDRATSRVSTDSVSWGLKGIDDGQADLDAADPGHETPKWNWDAMKFGGFTDAAADYGKKIY